MSEKEAIKEEQSVGEVRPADQPQNEIPGFVVRWTNGEGEEEEGPLSVLWKLIESYRVDIFEVSLLQITRDFVEFLQNAEELRVELASSFVVMAARLLYYKSRALLPDPGFEESEDEPRLPPELIQQLLEYRKFQMASEKMRELDDVMAGVYPRNLPYKPSPEDQEIEDDWLELDVVDLVRAFSDMVRRNSPEPEKARKYEIDVEKYSVEEKMAAIRLLLTDAVSFQFTDLFENIKESVRIEIVVTFLAILELTRLGELIIRQHRVFGDIEVHKKSMSVA